MQILVIFDNHCFVIDAVPSDTIKNVKAKIQDKMGIDSSLRRLYDQLKYFNDDDLTLSDYGIQKPTHSHHILSLTPPVMKVNLMNCQSQIFNPSIKCLFVAKSKINEWLHVYKMT